MRLERWEGCKKLEKNTLPPESGAIRRVKINVEVNMLSKRSILGEPRDCVFGRFLACFSLIKSNNNAELGDILYLFFLMIFCF